MVNKEIWVLEEHAVMLFGWVFWYLFASRAFGYRLDKWAYERLMARNDYLKKLVADDLKDAVEFRKVRLKLSEQSSIPNSSLLLLRRSRWRPSRRTSPPYSRRTSPCSWRPSIVAT